MADPIRVFRCDDDTWNKFQDFCISNNTKTSKMLLEFINSCIENNQKPIKLADSNQNDSNTNVINQILDLVYECQTKIEEQNYKISKLTDHIHDLEMKSKSNETNISILLENNNQLEKDKIKLPTKSNNIP